MNSLPRSIAHFGSVHFRPLGDAKELLKANSLDVRLKMRGMRAECVPNIFIGILGEFFFLIWRGEHSTRFTL